MKLLKNIVGRLSKGILLMSVAALAAVSCKYDDSELREQIDILVDKVYELEKNLNAEMQALKEMLRGKLLISDFSTDASTGISTVTMVNQAGYEYSFQLLPERDMRSFVTCITLSDGVAYWGYIAEDGSKQLFHDEDGNPIPVDADTPEVIEKDGDTYIVIGGVEYPMSGNSVFSDYELHTDPLTGELYAVTFTFGDDMTFTVTVDGACGFHFVISGVGFGGSEIISDYFVANGLTERVQIDARGVVDYVLQIPDGWRVKEYEDIYMGAKYFDITAPSAELVAGGVAAAEGELKVVAVLEGGKATVAKLFVSTCPFRSLSVVFGKASVEMYNGLQKFVYGVCPAAEYDEDAIFAVAEGLLMEYDYPAGYGVADHDLSDVSLEEIAGQELVPGEKYVFWAIPALYYYNSTDAGYYLEKGTFVKTEFAYSSVSFEVGNESFRDAQLTMDLQGVDSYFVGLIPAAEYMMEDIVYNLNNPGYYTAKTSPMSYDGSVFSFAGVTAEQATSYVAWLAVAEEGRTYTQDDVIVREFSTLNLTAGGSVKVEAGDVNATALDVEIPLTAAGAETIYYAYLTSSAASKYADNESRAMYLFENGLSVKAESVNAKASETISKTKPSTDYVLFAVASDSDGKYGDVLTLDCRTTEIAYNNLSVEVSLAKNDPNNVVLNISAKDAVGFVYWIGRTSDNTWKSSNYMGGSVETAQQYIYLNRDLYRITSVMEDYPIVDGQITMKDLEMDVEHVIVAMAKDADGGLSKAKEFRFVPRAVAIGEVVFSSAADWAAAKPVVEFMPEKFYAAVGQMSGQYGFNITVPSGFTAYVLCGTDSYLNEGDATKVLTVEEKIVKIIQYVDLPRDSDKLVDEQAWITLGYPHGYELYHHEHGNPLFGNVVIWASEEFHDKMCDCKENLKNERTFGSGENAYTVTINQVRNINDGKPVDVRQPQAIGSTSEVIDRVYVVCQDLEGNCYEPFVFDVDPQLFANAGARDE